MRLLGFANLFLGNGRLHDFGVGGFDGGRGPHILSNYIVGYLLSLPVPFLPARTLIGTVQT
jgi:hypothetical protein